MLISRDNILGADDIQTRTVDVPEWGGKVKVRGLSGAERDAWEVAVGEGGPRGKRNARAKLIVRCLVDDDGNRLFGDEEAGALGKKSGSAIARLFNVACELSGIGQDAEEEAEGNSDAAPSGASI